MVKCIAGQKYGRLTAIKQVEDSHPPKWLFQCECRNTCIKPTSCLSPYNSKVPSCGCYTKEARSKLHKDYIGKKYGRLTILKRVENRGHHPVVRCRCDCGKELDVFLHSLTSGNTASCGCYNREAFMNRISKHGMCDTPLYRAYKNMIQRCTNPNHPRYKDWGGRGISVCKEWTDDIQSFFEWAQASGYKNGLTIERIDNDKGYSPENCRWATPSEQQHNKRNTKYIELNGETRSILEWAELSGVNANRINTRYFKLNWTAYDAIYTPVKIGNRDKSRKHRT